MVRAAISLIAGLAADCGVALAGQPVDWQIGLQPAASSLMWDIHWFHDFTLIIISAIVVFVVGLLLFIIFRFNARANPTPRKTSHNTVVEVVWTVVPIIILVMIAIPSFRILFNQLEIPQADLTVKATGYQWYWGYEYSGDGEVAFEALMLSDAERLERKKKNGQSDRDVPRLLATDNDMVVPVGKVVRLQVTAADVIHAWAIPAFGVKIDAVPGRLNETWFRADNVGVYYGQCSELCGSGHAYMPIAVRVVTQQQYDQWLAAAAVDVEGANRQLLSMIDAAPGTAIGIDAAPGTAIGAQAQVHGN
jgi:cytochrome c oxidase subunit 2